MKKILAIVVIAVALFFGGSYFFNNYEIKIVKKESIIEKVISSTDDIEEYYEDYLNTNLDKDKEAIKKLVKEEIGDFKLEDLNDDLKAFIKDCQTD